MKMTINERKQAYKLFSRGDRVKVYNGEGDDEQFPGYQGVTGIVVALNINDIGASPKDPFFVVKLDNGITDGFWRGELEPAWG